MIIEPEKKVRQKELIFEPVSQMLENITRDGEHRANKSKKEIYFEPHLSNIYVEVGQNIGYDFGTDSSGSQFQNSSVAIECSDTDCLMHGDLITKDSYTIDAIAEIFEGPVCGIIDIHKHDDERHVHIACLDHYKIIEEKARDLNKLLIK